MFFNKGSNIINTDYIGKTVGIFTIVEKMKYKSNDGHSLYKGVCNECGFERVARISDLKATKKCTHIRIDGKVGFNITIWNNQRIGRIFSNMKFRCYNANSKDYQWYGGKGIKICDEWMDNPKLFEEWAIDNGYSDKLTIDRIDENKNYSPDNCRWITAKENAKYKSTTSIIDIDGITHTGREWSEILNLGTNMINTYIRKYGLENTKEFIKKYIKNPSLKNNIKSNQSYYDLYKKIIDD